MDDNDTVSEIGPVLQSELITFFDITGRSPECSACRQTEKGWLFHVETAPDESGPDAVMSVFLLPTNIKNANITKTMPVMCIECPQCGHLEFVNSIRARERLDSHKEGRDE